MTALQARLSLPQPPQFAAAVTTRLPLRDYQLAAIAAVEAAERRGVRRPLVALPTGSGKTVVFSALAHRRGGRALILAHRDELIQQAADKYRMVAPDTEVGVVKAAANAVGAPVVVASVQTLARSRRLQQLGRDWHTIVVDEAHHALADNTYGEILDGLNAFADDGPLTLGVTATPERGDRKPIGTVWDEIVYQRGILDLTPEYLCPLSAVQVRLAFDAHALHTRHGDFAEQELENALMDARAPEHCVAAYQTHASGRKALVFTPTVRMAYRMAQEFRKAGNRAEAIDGSVTPEERHAILRRFHRGETRVLCNCAVLTEGYDEPSIDCIVIARPTRSKLLFCQMIGRGTRNHLGPPEKEDCLVIDTVGASSRHDLVTTASLFGLTPEELVGRTVPEAIARKRGGSRPEAPPPIVGDLVAATVDLFRRRRLHWIPIGTDGHQFVLPLGDGYLDLEADPARDDAWNVVRYAKAGPSELVAGGLTLAYAQGVAEDRARALGAGALTNPDARWRREPASEKQLAALARLGIVTRDGLTKGEASDLMTAGIAGRGRR